MPAVKIRLGGLRHYGTDPTEPRLKSRRILFLFQPSSDFINSSTPRVRLRYAACAAQTPLTSAPTTGFEAFASRSPAAQT